MASASASPEPPSNHPDAAGCAGQKPEIGKRGESPRLDRAKEQGELYGPLGLERLAKKDGRALIIYARRERQGE
ncbi:MAG: hypothetical protein WAU42_14510 [Solirubrobacteraceae bacterium]